MVNENLLIYILMFPVIGILLLCFIPAREKTVLKFVALNASFLSFIGSLFLWGAFNKSTNFCKLLTQLSWFPMIDFISKLYLGIDGISLLFLFLTALLIPLCLWISRNRAGHNLKQFQIYLLVLDFLLIGTGCLVDLLFFYIFFETVLIPMYLIVGAWDSRERKILAAYHFFLYILLGSVVVLISIIYILEQKFLWCSFFLMVYPIRLTLERFICENEKNNFSFVKHGFVAELFLLKATLLINMCLWQLF